MDYPYNLPKEEVIRRIKEIYHAEYDPTTRGFDAYDQLLACESTAETEEPIGTNENVSASGNGNGTCKRRVNTELTESKLRVIKELRTCNYRTSPIKTASLLKQLFVNHETKAGHWLYISQLWTPRAINRTISQMIKIHRNGWQTIKNPAAYFTYSIGFRKKRRTPNSKKKQNEDGYSRTNVVA